MAHVEVIRVRLGTSRSAVIERQDRPGANAMAMRWRGGKTLGSASDRFCWSGRRDSNSRPPDPQSGALPNCATARQRGNPSRSEGFARVWRQPQTFRGGRAGVDPTPGHRQPGRRGRHSSSTEVPGTLTVGLEAVSKSNSPRVRWLDSRSDEAQAGVPASSGANQGPSDGRPPALSSQSSACSNMDISPISA
jgi:hypothetical protein